MWLANQIAVCIYLDGAQEHGIAYHDPRAVGASSVPEGAEHAESVPKEPEVLSVEASPQRYSNLNTPMFSAISA